MATYKAVGFDASVAVTQDNGGDVTVPFSFLTALADGGFATDHLPLTGDILKLLKIPKGAVIHDFYLNIPDLEGSGTPALTIEAGLLTQDNNAFLTASTAGR